MCKKPLRVSQMSNADVTLARGYADDLLRWETRGPGDTANAMRRLAHRYGVPVGLQWSLRYRPPKRLWSDLLSRIEAAHAAERQRQLRKLAHDAEVTARAAGSDHPAVLAAAAALGACGVGGPGADTGLAAAAAGSAIAARPIAAAAVNDLPLWRAIEEE